MKKCVGETLLDDRDVFLHLKHEMASLSMHKEAKTFRLISWNALAKRCHKVNNDGVVCIETKNAIVGA